MQVDAAKINLKPSKCALSLFEIQDPVKTVKMRLKTIKIHSQRSQACLKQSKCD